MISSVPMPMYMRRLLVVDLGDAYPGCPGAMRCTGVRTVAVAAHAVPR